MPASEAYLPKYDQLDILHSAVGTHPRYKPRRTPNGPVTTCLMQSIGPLYKPRSPFAAYDTWYKRGRVVNPRLQHTATDSH